MELESRTGSDARDIAAVYVELDQAWVIKTLTGVRDRS